MEKIPYLLVSKNQALKEILSFYLESALSSQVTIRSNETEALQYLRENENYPLILLYEYEAESYMVEDLYNFLKQHEKQVHIIILNEKFADAAKDFFKGIDFFHLKEKGKILDEIYGLTLKVFSRFQNIKNDQEYFKISLDCLGILKGLENTLYLKLPSGKYLKLLNSDDAKEGLDLQKYYDKNIKYLYLKSEGSEWIFSQIKKYFSYFQKDTNLKFELVDPEDEEKPETNKNIIKVTEDKYLDSDYKEEILEKMDYVLGVLMKHPKIENILQKINLKDEKVSFYSKKVRLLSIISCFLARELEWNSKSTIEKLVYAAFLHDITIAHNSKLLKTKNLKELQENPLLSKKEISLYKNHPNDAANLLKNSFSGTPFEAATLIEQHHETPMGTGFPDKIKWDTIAPLSALFIITNDFVMYILEDECPTVEEYMLIAEKRFEVSTFKKIFNRLNKIKINLPGK